MNRLKPRTIYLDADSEAFLLSKISSGFKASSYIRFLLHEAQKKEAGDINGTN